jgi:TRAP-type C4-dicarboxylate transport system substrate-binding protein
MKKAKLVVLLLVVTVAFVTAGGQEEKKAQSFELTYNQLEPPTQPQGITQLKFKEKIEQLSGGQIKVKIYASGSLFTQEGEVTALMGLGPDLSTIAFQDIAP